jgi:voltage-gated potassium channel
MNNLVHFRSLTINQREELLQRIERYTELPLLALAFAMLPLLIGPFLWDLSDQEQATYAALDGFIWAAFAADLGLKLIVAPKTLHYARTHWLDILIVAVPFMRPLRILRLFVYGIGLVFITATVATTLESSAVDAQITSLEDALWWAVVTITTVGYGDIVPVTVAGRAVGFVLMLGGIAFFSGVTANLSAFLVRSNGRSDAQLSALLQEVRQLRQDVQGGAPLTEGGGTQG